MRGEGVNTTIKELPEEERPREKMLKQGSKALSNAELLAIILRTGTKHENVINLAYKLLNHNGGLKGLVDYEVEQLVTINGVGLAKACQLRAAIEIGKRIAATVNTDEKCIRTPSDAAALLMEDMRYLRKEYLKAVLLNTKCGLISVEEISVGSLNSSIVHPREVFVPAVKKSSASIILAHNHPSGDPTPSAEDISITKRVLESGKILGIDLVDHIIIGDGKYVSLKEKGII